MTNEQDRKQINTVLGALVDKAARAAQYGSVVQRTPLLGKTITCPHCGTRRRQYDPTPCCNPQYSTHKRIRSTGLKLKLECEPRIVDSMIPRSAVAKHRKNPRLSRNKPPLFLVHQRLVEIEQNQGQTFFDELMGRTPLAEVEGLSGIVEARIIRARKVRARRLRDQQGLSRRINRAS